MTFFCQNLDAGDGRPAGARVKLEEFDMPGATIKTASMTGMASGAWFRDPEGNLLAVAEPPDDFLS